MRGHVVIVITVVCIACGTIGSEGEGDRDLPTSGVGPFRRLERDEVLGAAPFVLDKAPYAEPAVVALDEGVALFAVAGDAIVRTRATDARSFFGTPAVVLRADAAWEGGRVSGPSVVRRDGVWLLFYAAAGGIGVARSSNGLHFEKEPAPVLVHDPSRAWETSTPSAPGVAIFPDGRLHMFYAAGGAIGEAESDDGVAWSRVTPDPVLAPREPAVELTPGERAPFDTDAVGDPCVAVRTTAAGRLHVRVLYTGYANGTESAIGFAARYGDRGPLTRQTAPVLAVGKHEAAPALFEWGSRSLLYVQMEKTEGGATFSAIAASVSPPTDRLPPPTSSATEP